jgi:glycosyltransferase involved in cell wall biosynthesis
MNILLIPFDQVNHSKANVRLVPLMKEMVHNYQFLGVERVPYFNTQSEILRHIKFVIYLIRVVYHGLKYRKKIDLILTENLPFGLIGAIISAFIRKPLLWDTHDGNLLAHCQLLNCSPIYIKANLLLERFIGRMARVIIVPSKMDRQLYIKQGYRYKNKIEIISSGINLSVLEKKENKMGLRKKPGLVPEKKILIFGGNRDYPPNKEAAFWINDKLAPVLAEKFNQVQIIITGPGEVPQKIHPIVAFPGHVPDYFEHILSSDVCLVPYQMNTGISTKLIDYLACGRPTVTTVEVARLFPELVDGENVLIARDRKEFIEKTIAILENPVLGEKIGANGRKVIEEHYNIEVIGKLWQEVFESCVSNPKPFI